MLGSHFYYKNPFSAWQIPGYDINYFLIMFEFRLTDSTIPYSILHLNSKLEMTSYRTEYRFV